MKNTSSRQLFLNFLAQTSSEPVGLEVDHAEGVWLYGPDGKKYIDLISGVSVSSLGHCHPAVVKAVKDQAEKYMHLMVYGEYIQSPQVKLAEKLVSLLHPSLNNVYLTNSGSEAIEGAVKLAKRYTGRTEIIAFRNAYHGHTQGALSLMGDEAWKRAFRPLLPDVRFLDFNHLGQLEQISRSTACVVIEPVQGEAGVRLPDKAYLRALHNKCSETGALLIFDEVQTGFGRTGSLCAYQHYNIVPDILVLAKALGGGMPIGAFIAPKEIMSSLTHDPILGHITTFGGHPVCAAAALASLEVLSSGSLVSRVKEKSDLFISILGRHSAVREIRAAGLLIAVELGDERKNRRLIKKCLERGVVLDWFLFCPTAFRIAPPLIITEDEILLAAGIILDCWSS